MSPLVNGALCLSTPQHNGKSGTVPKYKVGRPLRGWNRLPRLDTLFCQLSMKDKHTRKTTRTQYEKKTTPNATFQDGVGIVRNKLIRAWKMLMCFTTKKHLKIPQG